MIAGTVTAGQEASIALEVIGPTEGRQQIEAVIDTGYNGYLTLSADLINALQLQFVGTRYGILADGSAVELGIYLARVVWHGREQDVLVSETEGGALVGMSLLCGSRLTMDVVENGEVLIEELLPQP